MAFASIFKGLGGKESEGNASATESSERDADGASSASFFSAGNNFLSSMQAKKEGFMSDLSTKLNSIKLPMDTGFTGSNNAKKGRKSGAGGGEDRAGDSSASEYGDDGDQPMYADEAPSERRLSSGSIDSLPDVEAARYRKTIAALVMEILNVSVAALAGRSNQEFQGFVLHHTGRSAFARELRKQTENTKQVPSAVLQRLAMYCGLVLEQCDSSDDFSPACCLLNIAFKVFEQSVSSDGRVVQTYLFKGLQDKAIWQSTRFWNAAIFIGMQKDRSSRSAVSSGLENNLEAEKELNDNVAYNHLSKFAWRMYSLGLNKDACMDFIRRQAEDTSLSQEKLRTLRANVNNFYSD